MSRVSGTGVEHVGWPILLDSSPSRWNRARSLAQVHKGNNSRKNFGCTCSSTLVWMIDRLLRIDKFSMWVVWRMIIKVYCAGVGDFGLGLVRGMRSPSLKWPPRPKSSGPTYIHVTYAETQGIQYSRNRHLQIINTQSWNFARVGIQGHAEANTPMGVFPSSSIISSLSRVP